MSLFDRPEDPSVGLTPDRIREVCDSLDVGIGHDLHPSLAPFTADEVDRLWCAMFPTELTVERDWSPAKRARLDQLRAALREGEL